MARLLDYQFDNFSTDANGNRVIINAGTLGSANDAIMHTGQGLEFDGVDDYIDTGFYPDETSLTLLSTFSVGTAAGSIFGSHDANNRRFYCGYDTLQLRYGYGDKYVTDITVVDGDIIVFGMTYDVASTTVKAYLNGTLARSDSATWNTGAATQDFYLGKLNNYAFFYSGNIYSVAIINATLSDADMLYHANNPEAVISMLITQTDNPNFSFSYTNIVQLYTLDEGAGNTIYELVSGTALAMQNFPTDDTQWTNANEESIVVHQKERYKKDVNGNPSALADLNTVRFD